MDRSLDDIFAVQDEIASQVALALRGSLLDEVEVAATRGGGTDNTEAYDLYLRALEGFRTETERATRDAERQLRRAIEKDPNFALAWSLLARTIMQRGYLEGMRREDWWDEALSTANTAVELAPETTMTLATLGFIHLNRQEFSLGIDRLEQALLREPNHAQALSWLSAAQFGSMKYEDALRTAQRAMSIDPLDFKLKGDSVFLFTQVGRLQEAELLAKSVLANDPDSVDGLGALGNLYWRTGRLADAIEVYQKLLVINPNYVNAMDRITASYYWVGDFESAGRWLQRMEAVNPRRGRYSGARICFYQGDLGCALAYMDLALKDAANEEQRNDALGEIAYMTRDWPAMLEMKLYEINNRKARGMLASSAFELSWAILAADRMGDIKSRDLYISEMMTGMESWIANGGDSQYYYWLAAEAQALAGNAEKAAELLNKGIDRGYRDLQRLLMGGHYEKILDHPAIKGAVARLTEINKRELEAMRLVDPVE